MRRADGYIVDSNDPMYQIVPYIMPERLDASNDIDIDIDLEPIQSYIKKTRANGKAISHMAVIATAYLRVASQNPFLNRFCMNRRIYARNHFCISFVTLIPERTGNTVNKIYLNLDDDIFTVNDKINNAIETSRSDLMDNSMDNLANKLTRLPLLLKFGAGFLKFLDKHFTMPRWAINASPFHTSLFITNLASIRSNAIHHHLYEFGTTGVFIAMGMPEKKIYINDDGEADERKIMELKITTDERIADGHYYVRCFKEINKYFKNPELLEKKPESIIYDPDVRRKKWKWLIRENNGFREMEIKKATK